MSTSHDLLRKVVPAQLGFFAIYNPSLGTTDETFENQIVYYSSQESRERSRHRQSAAADNHALREENNEQLRQIGLAQGMVEFGRSFAEGRSVDTVETEKSRIILHELEVGWWVLASINLTVLPPSTKTVKGKAPEEERPEYSSREVKPAILLLGDVLRAHSTFLLHHASSMSALFVRTRRSKFVGILGRYWDTYLSTWTVLMHGNPARNLYGGIKIAACGELGVGVGEEERGSGERAVLEGFVGRIDGLVDVIVSKFGDGETKHIEPSRNGLAHIQPISPWLGSGNEPAAEDGAVFLGTGALSRKSMRDVSHWVEDLYRWGPYTYGVVDNPTSNRRPKISKKTESACRRESAASSQNVPRPALSGLGVRDKNSRQTSPLREESPQAVDFGRDGANDDAGGTQRRPSFRRDQSSYASTDSDSHKSGNKFVQYLKLGYGTHWSLGNNGPPAHNQKARSSSPARMPHKPSPITLAGHDGSQNPLSNDSEGHYLIGLTGEIDEQAEVPNLGLEGALEGKEDADGDNENERVLLRTLTVELEREEDARAEADISIDLSNAGIHSNKATQRTGSERTGTSNTSFESQDRNKTKKLRVVVYVKRPFIFVLIFELRSEVLAMPSLYRSLHHQLSPLVKPMLTSTTFRALKPDMLHTEDTTPIYDLIWDPKLLTITSNIPNIPDPSRPHHPSSYSLPWSRVEALNTHMQIINTYLATTTDAPELERTCKTSRGWWVVWTRIPDPEPPAIPLVSGLVKVPGRIVEDSVDNLVSLKSAPGTSKGTSTFGTSMVSGPAHPFLETPKNGDLAPRDREIFLIRRASDHDASKVSGRFTGSSPGSVESWTAGPGKLAQGIGVDTKWYIETLLNLRR